jgi:hypothetical protein
MQDEIIVVTGLAVKCCRALKGSWACYAARSDLMAAS